MDKVNKFPYEITPFSKEENVELLGYMKGLKLYFSRVGPKGYVMTRDYNIDMATNIYNFPLRIDDTFVVTYPKSGTTWTQELVWLILNNLDYEKSNSVFLKDRCPFLEVSLFMPHEEIHDVKKEVVLKALTPITVDQIKELPSPRLIKTHMPLSLLPPTLLDDNKVVYVARDPRDVAVSFFHHYKLTRLMALDRDFKTYWNYFINDKITWCPYFASVLEAWEKRNHPNMLFLFYEELSEDLAKVIRRVAKFFKKQLSDDQVAELREHLKFDNFKKNKSVNMEDMQEKGFFTSHESFIRKGQWHLLSRDWSLSKSQPQSCASWQPRACALHKHFQLETKINKKSTMENKSINNYPLEIRDVDEDVAEKLMKLFTGEHTGFVHVGPKGYFLPNKFKEEALNIYNMALRPTDVFVASYPRSGTTWTQELVWMVVNDLDYEKSNTIPLTERYPFLEFSVFVHPVMKQRFYDENSDSEQKLKLLDQVSQSGTEQLAETPSPRFVKTHLPLSLLPPSLLDTAKVIYVARDPRDVAVSFYHLNKGMRTQGYLGDFKAYWQFFIQDLHHWTPYFAHLKESWEQRHHPNLLFMFYEEMSKDLPASVRRVTDFFGKQFSEKAINQLCDHLSIENFKRNKSVNYDVMRELGILQTEKEVFIRKGKAGGWRDYFDNEMSTQAEQWISDNLKDTDLRFPHLD